ncbi:hypothetical protein C7445_1307 [Alicyclobacillus sacchari]|uniref:Uncharacterized protein n=1 Tax=Alicyclobacillus sacchari TaxID=392010 RepID=A0A4V3HCY2_9BACL|nr:MULTISPECIES: hypothetical protein [Alicyclobacillus]EJY57311.1 hypothetical protein URH17368_0034 [Alicyclobacillus hesperidum URH17-3-68]KRW90627.1 hypothetical protein SD51_13780 [Alicyclobacillus tengchongensis]TDY38874.1 hypothetical protein C7445_1307 [Alicyclobacillus sacchari]GMA59298.1 hypothetical protein GCM10025858_38010 [Alicyclobacillus sacchari]
MSPSDKKKRFESLMPSRTETPPHKTEVIDGLMGGNTPNPNTEQVHRVSTLNTYTEHTNETPLHRANTVQEISHTPSDEEPHSVPTSFDIASKMRAYEQEKKAKKSYDELYTKHTFVVRRDLLERLEKLSRKHSRGFKTKFLNEILEAGLNQLDSTTQNER